MTEWWTYSLSDFLLFSPRVYYRLIELHNRELWPAHLATGAAGAVALALFVRPVRFGLPAAIALLGGLWLWVAWAFFWDRYATINWAAVYVAPVFALEALMLFVLGAFGPSISGRRRLVLARLLFGFALLGYPLLAPLAGRSWLAAETLGLLPDPTALATLALLAPLATRWRWVLMVVPALWCLVGGATLLAMGSPVFPVAPLGAAAAVAIAAMRR